MIIGYLRLGSSSVHPSMVPVNNLHYKYSPPILLGRISSNKYDPLIIPFNSMQNAGCHGNQSEQLLVKNYWAYLNTNIPWVVLY